MQLDGNLARLDPLLQAVRQRKGEALILVASEQAQIKSGSSLKPLIKQVLTAAQIRRLLSEIVEPEQLRTMALDALFPLFAQPDEAIEGSLGELSGRPASPGSARD